VNFSAPVKSELAMPLRRLFEDKLVRIPMDDAVREDLHASARSSPRRTTSASTSTAPTRTATPTASGRWPWRTTRRTTPQQQSRLDDLTRSSLLNARFHEAAVQQSWAGGAFLEADDLERRGVDRVAPAEEMFPQGRLRPDGQFSSYARYTEDVIPGADGKEPLRVVLKTTYTRGLITRELRTLDDEGKFKGELPLEKWPAFAGEEAVPAPEQPTGIGECSIVYVPNKLDDSIGISDFDGLIELQDNVNAKYAQFAKVIAQHGDPKLWFGTEGGGAGDTAQVRATDNAFWGPEKPEYIVWEAQLDAARRTGSTRSWRSVPPRR
jgi:hypothetical protein